MHLTHLIRSKQLPLPTSSSISDSLSPPGNRSCPDPNWDHDTKSFIYPRPLFSRCQRKGVQNHALVCTVMESPTGQDSTGPSCYLLISREMLLLHPSKARDPRGGPPDSRFPESEMCVCRYACIHHITYYCCFEPKNLPASLPPYLLHPYYSCCR
jgi:hypothetical protein